MHYFWAVLYLRKEYLEILGVANDARLEAILFVHVTARALTTNHLHGSSSHVNVRGVPSPKNPSAQQARCGDVELDLLRGRLVCIYLYNSFGYNLNYSSQDLTSMNFRRGTWAEFALLWYWPIFLAVFW